MNDLATRNRQVSTKVGICPFRVNNNSKCVDEGMQRSESLSDLRRKAVRRAKSIRALAPIQVENKTGSRCSAGRSQVGIQHATSITLRTGYPKKSAK